MAEYNLILNENYWKLEKLRLITEDAKLDSFAEREGLN